MADGIKLTGLPENGVIFVLDDIQLSVSPLPHPFLSAHRDAIAENWRKEHEAQPALFDGQILLHSTIELTGSRLHAVSHLTPFSAFLLWRKQPGRAGAAHLFGVAVIVSSDGAILAVRMSEHTANPGRVYCAAGSLDAHDMTEAGVDINANMQREVAEETGLDLSDAVDISRTYGLWQDRCLTVFRYYRFARSAEALLAEIRDHMTVDKEKEISEPIAIWSPDRDAHPYGHFMPAVLKLYFETRPEGDMP